MVGPVPTIHVFPSSASQDVDARHEAEQDERALHDRSPRRHPPGPQPGPSGHRLELAADTATPKMNQMLDEVKWDMLNEWDRTKKAPTHARWMHDGSYAN